MRVGSGPLAWVLDRLRYRLTGWIEAVCEGESRTAGPVVGEGRFELPGAVLPLRHSFIANPAEHVAGPVRLCFTSCSEIFRCGAMQFIIVKLPGKVPGPATVIG